MNPSTHPAFLALIVFIHIGSVLWAIKTVTRHWKKEYPLPEWVDEIEE